MIELSEDQENLFTILLYITLTLLLCQCLYYVLKYFYNHAYFQPCTLPGVTKLHLFQYLILLKLVYKQSRPAYPALCLALQAVFGVCRMFDKERICRIYLLFKPLVFFYKPETVEVLLSSSTMIDKAREYELLSSWLGKGLLTSGGERWRHRRKLLTPAFHFSILEDFIPIFQEQSRVLISKIQRLRHEPYVHIGPLITSCTLDVICETAMGVSINAQSGENNDYARAIYEIGNAFMYRLLRPWLYPDIIFNWTVFGRRFNSHVRCVQEFTRKVIKEKKADMIACGKLSPVVETAPDGSPMFRKKRKAFLELMLEHHLKEPLFTEEDIREEVDTFMFEGHDTTAVAICWTLYCLGLYPEAQRQVHDELDVIFQDDLERDITREDLTKMKYLECAIKETLRLYPSVPMIGRKCDESFKVLNHTVHRGSVCVIFPIVLHQDAVSFPEPEKFIPERFLPENSKGRHPYAYIPFSAGSRNCIGQKFAMMEEKTILANVFRQFRVTSLDPSDKVNITINLTTRSVGPLRLHFQLR